MLCERIPINNCLKVLNTSVFYIENKLDGERIQLHMKDGEFQYWSRYFFLTINVIEFFKLNLQILNLLYNI